jgi:hypothetical protein
MTKNLNLPFLFYFVKKLAGGKELSANPSKTTPIKSIFRPSQAEVFLRSATHVNGEGEHSMYPSVLRLLYPAFDAVSAALDDSAEVDRDLDAAVDEACEREEVELASKPTDVRHRLQAHMEHMKKMRQPELYLKAAGYLKFEEHVRGGINAPVTELEAARKVAEQFYVKEKRGRCSRARAPFQARHYLFAFPSSQQGRSFYQSARNHRVSGVCRLHPPDPGAP